MAGGDRNSSAGGRDGTAKWVGAPIIPGDWFDILPDEASEILTILGEYLRSAELPAFLAQAQLQGMRALELDAYPDWLLIECQAQINSESVVLFNYMFGPTGAILLDGRADALHAFNRLAGINIVGPQAAGECLSFSCGSVRSGLGRFEIIGSIADLYFSQGTTRLQKTAVRRQLKPLRQVQTDESGIVFQTTVRYGTSLFHSLFRVPPAGHVEMLEDHEIEFEATLETELFEGPFRIPAARPL
ncbi:MAG: hypothetical protein KJ944_17015 [Alphaproteobacteria bacterium]|nr:hypothetical protein [Alphaproteobacteria bacterium]MBU1563101.1 hypothetical protein [Alphaproteobacteria bacterium]MBU2304295.1 hypothetical protein [Alphaproteobacteria bacterium]MBU2368297.1 hypothetical protein [Alphaproteobacteria bacterium]